MLLALVLAGTITVAQFEPAELPKVRASTLLALEKTLATDAYLQRQNIHRRVVGDITVPSGRVIAIDPISLEGAGDIFLQKIPSGSFPVYAYVLNVGPNDDRIALVELRISNNLVSNWKLAQTAEQIPPESLDDADYGYFVGGATGAFLSPESLMEIMSPKLYPEGSSFYSEYLQPLLSKAEQPAAFLFKLPANPDVDVAIFETGDSDGIYPSYFGYDDDGSPVRLVTTFYMIENHAHVQ